MARTQARKVTPKHHGMGGAVPAHYEGGDFDLNGYFIQLVVLQCMFLFSSMVFTLS